MKFWQTLQFTPVERLVPLAHAIEQKTLFHGVNLGDHSLYHESIVGAAAYAPGGKMPWSAETPWPDIGAAFGAITAVTQRLHCVTSILVLPHHQPFEVARCFATLSALSGNRVALGTGVGWLEIEYKSLGLDYKTRGQRYDEMLDVIRLLWRGEMAEYHGRFFDFPRAQLRPKPAGRIPIYVGGDSPAALRRAAAKGDGWISGGVAVDRLPEDISALNALREEAGLDKRPFEIIANVGPNLDLIKRLRDIGVTSIFNLPATEELAGSCSLQQKIDDSCRYSDEIIAKL
jgi:probable F420-dependent oxidoreductase